MPNNGQFQYSLPTATELERLDRYEVEFPRQIAFALRWIYNLHHWTGADLESRIPGVKASVWQRYAQPAYTKARSLHVVAALSWVSQVSMSAILYGDRIAQYWPSTPREKIEVFIYCGLMGSEEFSYFVTKLIQENRLSSTEMAEIELSVAKINTSSRSSYLAPKILDVEEFGRDYYRSLAIMLKRFRESQNFSISDMAIVLNLSDHKYRSIENADNPPKTMSLHLAARLKLAFKIPNTVPFLSQMGQFPGFAKAREIQQDRELLLLKLLNELPQGRLNHIANFADELVQLENRTFGCVQYP